MNSCEKVSLQKVQALNPTISNSISRVSMNHPKPKRSPALHQQRRLSYQEHLPIILLRVAPINHLEDAQTGRLSGEFEVLMNNSISFGSDICLTNCKFS